MRSFLLALCAVFPLTLWAGDRVHRPPRWSPGTGRMVVVIHGCLQGARTMERSTGWNQVADKYNLLVFYPDVPAGSNAMDCWNWFVPANQVATGGQLKMIADKVRELLKSEGMTQAPVYVTGLSSGSATAAGLLACFPELFAGGALHSGPVYASAQSLDQAEKALKEGPSSEAPPPPCEPKTFRGKLMILHGTEDTVVNPLHATRSLVSFRGIEALPLSEAKEANGLRYSVSRDPGDRTRIVMIEGLGHAWSGFVRGKLGLVPPFFSAQGPSATELMWDFFSGNEARNEKSRVD